MLTPQTLNDLNKAFQTSPQGFVVVDSGRPKFVVLGYQTYQQLREQKKPVPRAGKILVTGGAGYIGAVTVRLLQQRGYEVIVYDNLSTGLRERVKDCQLVVADLADRAALEKVFSEEKIETVIHFAASIEVEESMMDPSKYLRNNVVNGLNLLDAMTEHEVDKIVFSSTAAVYGEPEKLPITEDTPCMPTNFYGETKLMFEKILQWYAQCYGLRSASLRYFNAAGAWEEEDLGYNLSDKESHLIPRVLNVALGKSPEIEIYGQDYPTPDGTCIRDYIHVLDLAHAHLLALQKLEQGNGAYVHNVGSGQGHSVLEVVEEAVEVTGRMIPIRVSSRRPGDSAQLVADNGQLLREFGFRPKYDLRSILESSWRWQNHFIPSP